MKNIILFFSLTFFSQSVFSQVPDKINYQGVARDASGNPIANSVIGLQFKISTSVNPNFYNETQPSVQTNSLGLFSTKIGLINPLPLTGWENLPSILSVSINDGSGFVTLPSQTLASVPYALYALSSGNTLPNGIREGQSLRWDSVPQVWKKSNNLTNDDIHVGVGVNANGMQNKFQVFSNSPLDSSGILSVKLNAKGRDAAIRGWAVGSTPSTTNIGQNAIYGSDNFGINNSGGAGIGVSGFGISSGYAYGVTGVAVPNSTVAYAIGLYGGVANSTLSPFSFAGYLDGNVFIRDSLVFGSTANPGSTGDVLTRSSTGKVRWQTPITGGFNPFTLSANIIHLIPANANSKVVIGNTTPALFGYGSKLTVYNPVGTNDTALSVIQNTNSHALNAKTIGTGFAINAINSNASTTAYAGFFDGGLVAKGKNNLPASSGFIVRNLSNTDLLTVKNDGKVGIGTSSPIENVQIETTGSTALSIIATSLTTSNLFFGDQSLHTKGAIQYDNNLNTMSIWTNNTPNRIFITNNGNVGLKTNNPGPYDLSVFNTGTSTSIRLNNNSSAGIGLVLNSNNVSSNLISYDNTVFNFGNNSTTFMSAQPNGNVGIGTISPSINSRLAIKDGHFQSQQTNAPTIVGNNNATATFWNGNQTDVTGIIQISMGAATLPGAQATVTFNKTYNSIPTVILTPVVNYYGALAVANSQVFVVASPSGFIINFNTAYPLTATTMYFNYMVIEGN